MLSRQGSASRWKYKRSGSMRFGLVNRSLRSGNPCLRKLPRPLQFASGIKPEANSTTLLMSIIGEALWIRRFVQTRFFRSVGCHWFCFRWSALGKSLLLSRRHFVHRSVCDHWLLESPDTLGAMKVMHGSGTLLIIRARFGHG